jgi:adhesin/invasin
MNNKDIFRNLLTACLLFLLGAPAVVRASPGKALPPYIVDIVVITDNQMADGSHNDIVQVTVYDAGLPGNPVANGVTVNFKLQGATASNSLTTNSSGMVVYPVNNTTVGVTDLSITVNGITQHQSLNFIAGPPSANPPGNPPGSTSFTVIQDNAAADGSSQDQVMAHISDQFGNSVGAGVSVVFTLTGGVTFGTAIFQPNSSTTTYTGTTDASGNIVLPITSTKLGDLVVHAILNGVEIGNTSPQTVHFVKPPPSPNPPNSPNPPASPSNPNGSTNFFITLDDQIANGSATDKVKAHITDAVGNSSGAGVQVTITITGNGTAAGQAQLPGNVTTIVVTTDANGDVEVPITDTKTGTVELSASIIDATTTLLTQIHGSTQTVTFVAGPPSANPPSSPNPPASPSNPNGSTNFYITQDNQVADLVQQDKVKAHITDAFGNAVGAGVQVTITITGNGTAAGPAELPGNVKTITVTTDANGDVEVPIIDTKAGKVELSATIIDPVTSLVTAILGSTQTVTFVAGPAVPSAPLAPSGTGSQLSVTQNFRIADGSQVDSVLAHITDKYGNPVAGALVTFSITAGGTATAGAALVGTVTLATDANGNIEIAINSNTPGTVFINGALNLTDLVDGSYQTVTFDNAPDVNNPQTQLIVVVYENIADGTSTTAVKAHVVDQGGNIMVGQDVTFAMDSGTATIVTPQPVQTDANGDAFISITSTKTGFVLITATVGNKAITYGSPARVKFVPINIYVPRVFTPNNDGNNDVLKPILVGIATFHYMNVYNRWGNLVFTTQDPTRGWDGTFKGVAQPVETYLWIAEGVDIEGKTIVQKGMTSLVR